MQIFDAAGRQQQVQEHTSKKYLRPVTTFIFYLLPASWDVLDAMVAKVPKTYPSYIGAYQQLMQRQYLDTFDNLYLVGRNGLHRYNNQGHSMLTAMRAVENIITGNKDKSIIWPINAEQEYHEESGGQAL